MAEKRVSVRLSAKGGKQVKAEFDGIGKAGQKGFKSTSVEIDRTNVRLAKFARIAATVVTSLAATATIATAALIRETARTSREIENLSAVAGVGTERFQEIAFAAKSVGVEQEKLSDILKDVSDKFGDFLQNNGGPAQDFFKNIAPQVGVTAEMFRKLSSADALQLYVSTLEKANLSQSEMTFYMEAIASDATRLLPLFSQNGAALADLSQQARNLGIVLDEDIIRRSKKMDDIWTALMSSMKAKFVSFAGTVLVGMDGIFGLTDEGQLENLNGKLGQLADERDAILARIEDFKVRSPLGSKDPNVKYFDAPLQANIEEMNLVNDQMQKIKDSIQRVNLAKKALNAALTAPTPAAIKLPSVIDRTKASVDSLKKSSQDMGQSMRQTFIGLLTGARNLSDVFSQLLLKAAEFQAGKAFDALMGGFNKTSDGKFKGIFGGAILPGILHAGGIAGVDGYGTMRAVSPAVFAGAPRMHSGGIAGSLRPDEVPAILQRGERVLSRTEVARGASSSVVRVELGSGLVGSILAQARGASVEITQSVIGQYDQKILPTRVQQISNDPLRDS